MTSFTNHKLTKELARSDSLADLSLTVSYLKLNRFSSIRKICLEYICSIAKLSREMSEKMLKDLQDYSLWPNQKYFTLAIFNTKHRSFTALRTT